MNREGGGGGENSNPQLPVFSTSILHVAMQVLYQLSYQMGDFIFHTSRPICYSQLGS